MTPRRTPMSTRLTLLGAAVTLALATACGGGGSSSAPPPSDKVTAIPEGIWGGNQLYSNQTKSTTALALVLGDGETRIINGNGFQYVTTLDQGQGSGTAYDIIGVPPAPFTVMETALTPKGALGATLTVSGDVTALALPLYDSHYDTPLTVAALVGSFASPNGTNTFNSPSTLTLGADGTFTGSSAAGDTYTGTYTIPDPNKSAVKVSFMYTPPGSSTAEAMTGLATFVPSPNQPTPSLGLMASGTTTSIVANFVKQ